MEYGSGQLGFTLLAAVALGVMLGYLIWGAKRSDGPMALVKKPAEAKPAPSPAPKPAPAPKAAAKPKAKAAPSAPAAAAEASADTVTAELPPAPESLFQERPDTVDDLQKIKGVGPKMESVLNEKGVYQYAQLANFTADDLAWLDAATGSFPGRAERDDWVGQAKGLMSG